MATAVWRQCLEGIVRAQNSVLGAFMPNHAEGVPLFDPATHWNIGDNLIALGKLRFAARNHINVFMCDGSQTREKINSSHSCRVQAPDGVLYPHGSATRDKIAWYHGGGNWGDLYPAAHRERRTIARQLIHNFSWTVVFLASSLHFNRRSLKRGEQEIFSHPGAVLCWRQLDSYHSALHLYPDARNLLVPDMAFSIGPQDPSELVCARTTGSSMVDVLFLLRSDEESVVHTVRNSSFVRSVLNSLGATEVTFRIVDWKDANKLRCHSSANHQNRKQDFFERRMNLGSSLLTSGKVVVTDRLHASILALLLHWPHVVLDKKTRKIEFTRQVAFNTTPAHCNNQDALNFRQVRPIECLRCTR